LKSGGKEGELKAFITADTCQRDPLGDHPYPGGVGGRAVIAGGEADIHITADGFGGDSKESVSQTGWDGDTCRHGSDTGVGAGQRDGRSASGSRISEGDDAGAGLPADQAGDGNQQREYSSPIGDDIEGAGVVDRSHGIRTNVHLVV